MSNISRTESEFMTPEQVTQQPAENLRLRLSVVIPVHNSTATLAPCVEAALLAAGSGDEVILADDGSTDGCIDNLDAALLSSVRVVVSPVNIGRGPVRNLGAEAATGDVLVFIDSDVALESSAIERFRAAFEADPERVAIIGSYDDHPADAGRISQYRNLLHHHTHHTHGSFASHFWTGIGAVRKRVFVELGGLNTDRWARDMEDVEFGHRIIDAGYAVEVMPDICGTHFKSFTLRSMIRVDLRNRAIPWSHLMIASGFRSDPFVTSPSQILSALTVGLTLLALAVTPVFVLAGWVALAGFISFIVLNRSLWKLLAKRDGFSLVLAAIPLHFIHTALSGFGFVIAIGQRLWHAVLGRRLKRRRRERRDKRAQPAEVRV